MFNSFLKRGLLAVCIANALCFCNSASAGADGSEPVMQITDIKVKVYIALLKVPCFWLCLYR